MVRSNTNLYYDVAVVGAGPAGSAAAIAAAKEGVSVALIERGIYPGAKNVYGGVMYLKVLDRLVPSWRDEVPYERWVTKRHTMILEERSSVTFSFHDETWGEPPYNGATVLRSRFDPWLSLKAQQEGAELLTATTISDIQIEEFGPEAKISLGVADSSSRIVCRSLVLAEGALGLLSESIGLGHKRSDKHMTLGVKEVLYLGEDTINERFGVRYDHGVDIEILGGTKPLVGGGFLYTNKDTVSIGAIVTLESLKAMKVRPEEALEAIKHHPSIAPYVADGKRAEYLAHLIPEGGWKERGELSRSGVFLAGEVASSTLAAGLWLEGINYAIEMGSIAGGHSARYVKSCGKEEIYSPYSNKVSESFVGKNLRRLRFAPEVVLSKEVQEVLPKVVNELAHELFTVTDPEEKRGVAKSMRDAIRDKGLEANPLIRTLIKTIWSFR
jgi:electron transfer flavoprotein-quinone oxidoreductase